MLTVGSMFAGIGGLDHGLELAGMRTVWQIEADAWRRDVLAHHWPDVPRYDDVTTADPAQLQAPDVIAAGFPCQDVSQAGAKAGLDGDRSGLWTEVVRFVRGHRPRWVLVENVTGLLHRGIDTVLGDLAACGYDAEWDCVPATAVGAPHRRDRVWIVAYPAGPADAGPRVWREGRELPWRRPAAGRPRWPAEPAVGRVADGLSRQLDRRREHALGDAVVPQVVAAIGRAIILADAEPWPTL